MEAFYREGIFAIPSYFKFLNDKLLIGNKNIESIKVNDNISMYQVVPAINYLPIVKKLYALYCERPSLMDVIAP